MWGRKRRRPDVRISSLVGAQTEVLGDLHFHGGCHVDGYVKGDVSAVRDSPSVLSISEEGAVEGNVQVGYLVLHGTIRGDVWASERVELGKTARVIGNVYYRYIETAIGAEINGKLIHEAAERTGPAEDGRIDAPPDPAAGMLATED